MPTPEKKIERNSPEWEKMLFEALFDDFGEAYKACQECSKPTHVTYKCRWCGSKNP